VRVHLASPINVPLGEVTLFDVRQVEGIVAQSGGDSLQVFGKWLYPGVGRKYDALGAAFSFSRGDISHVERYRFSGTRTVLAAVVAGAIVVGFLEAIRIAGSGEPPGGNGTPGASVRGWVGGRE
jgi:hypothetical protein